MLTNDRVLAVFQDYIREDSSCEVVQTSRGYTLLEWNECENAWYDAQLCQTPELLRDALLDAYTGYLEYTVVTHGERDLTAAENRLVQAAREVMLERCREGK